MDISVVARGREDGATTEEILGLASAADDLGYPELWVGEGPTWDAFVLAAAIGLDEVALVPMTAGDPSGERTLRTVRSLTYRQPASHWGSDGYDFKHAVARKVPPLAGGDSLGSSPVVGSGQQGVEQTLASKFEFVHPCEEQGGRFGVGPRMSALLGVPPLLTHPQSSWHVDRCLEPARIGDHVTELGEDLWGEGHGCCATNDLISEQ